MTSLLFLCLGVQIGVIFFNFHWISVGGIFATLMAIVISEVKS
jgi:hypothetical protein